VLKNSESGKDDVRDVYGLEQSPVPRHPKVTARQRSRILKAFRKALEHRDERLFLEAIRRDLGWQDDTPEFAQAFQEWRKLWGK
jgi:acyl-CoA reductase-like NAD-dependent aldehyde dehydrogenase